MELTSVERELLLREQRPVDVLQGRAGGCYVHRTQWECVQEVMAFLARASMGTMVGWMVFVLEPSKNVLEARFGNEE